jgi:hypothetical protein
MHFKNAHLLQEARAKKKSGWIRFIWRLQKKQRPQPTKSNSESGEDKVGTTRSG